MSKNSDEVKYQKLLIFGKKGCGKTSLVQKMEKGTIEDEYIQNEEINQVGSHIKVKEESLYLNTIEYRINKLKNEECLLKSCLYACKCAVFMIDATSEDSLPLVKEFLEKINKEEYPNLSFIFLLNKIDKEKVINFEEVKALSDKINQGNSPERAVALEISLKDEKNYKQLINTISKSLSRNFGFSIDNISDLIKRPQPQQLNKFDLIRIMLIGNCIAGKSTFIQRYLRGVFIDLMPSSISISEFARLMKVNDKIFEIKILDTPGRIKLMSMIKYFFRNLDGLIIFYDVTFEESFQEVKDWLYEAEDNIRKTAIIYIAGNKVDLPNREVSTEDGENFAKMHKAKYYEISSKINLNVNEIILDLILECIKAKESSKLSRLSELSKRKKKKSCVIF